MGKIVLEGLKFHAYHGYYEEEKRKGNTFIVDVEIEADLSKAGASDRLEDTLDYEEIYNLIREEMNLPSNLLEHVAQRILTKIIKYYKEIKYLEISLSKLNPPIGGKCKTAKITLSYP